MLKNYFKIAIRNLLKHKVFTFINIFGLATGMAVCMLIVLFIQSELNYDNFQQHGNNVYRIALERRYNLAPRGCFRANSLTAFSFNTTASESVANCFEKNLPCCNCKSSAVANLVKSLRAE